MAKGDNAGRGGSPSIGTKVARNITLTSPRRLGKTATSSVKSALVRMLDEESVYWSPDGYLVYDRFFGQWLDATF